MAIAFNGELETGQFLGDTITSIKAAYLFAQAHPCSRYMLSLTPRGQLNFLWQKFIDAYNVEIIHDDFDTGNMQQRFAAWDKWRKEREINGKKFDIYKELYRRIDGGNRQPLLCGKEAGLGRKNIFEYFYFGQEEVIEPCVGGQDFPPGLIYYKPSPPQWDVFCSPYAKCQGNSTFTFQFWDRVVRKLVGQGVKVTVGHNGEFCDDLKGSHYRRIFCPYKELPDEIASHRLLTCGNTGTGWIAACVGTPLLSMQPPDSNMQDYRYEWCGVRSLIEFVEKPDDAYVVRRIIEELDKKTVFTAIRPAPVTGAVVRHLEEARSLGNRLVVGLVEGNLTEDQTTIFKGLRCVDEVRTVTEDFTELVEQIRPAVVASQTEPIPGKAFVESYGGKAVLTTGKPVQLNTPVQSKPVLKEVDVLAAVRDGCSVSVNPFHKMKSLADEYLSVAGVRGAVADVGTCRGGCALVMRRLGPDRELHCFDTWTGNPHDDPLCHHKVGEWAADLAECRCIISASPGHGVIHCHVGVFPRTAQEADLGRFAFVFVDGDTYQTTRDAIEFFWPRMVEGGKMMFDDCPDWPPCAGVEKAVREAFPADQLQLRPDALACVVVKK